MRVTFYLDTGTAELGELLGSAPMSAAPRRGEAVFIPGESNSRRIKDVIWMPGLSEESCLLNVTVSDYE